MDRMGIAARGLERREHRRGLGPARDHEALAQRKILEPALVRHHAMLGGVELGHIRFPVMFFLRMPDVPVSQRSHRDNWLNSSCPGLSRASTSLKRRYT